MFPRPLLVVLGILTVLLAGDVLKISKSPGMDTPPRLAALSSQPSSDASERDVVLERTFDVDSSDRLVIDVAHTDVVVRTGSTSEVSVRVEASGDRGRAFYEHLNFSVEKVGESVSVTTNPSGRWRARSGGDVNTYVIIPSAFDAEIEVAHGDLNTESLNGSLSLSISHGDLAARTLGGSTLRLESAHGDVSIEEVSSGKIQIRTAHGDVDIDRLTAVEFNLDIQHGDIHIARAEGYARASAAHGDISIQFLKMNGGLFTAAHGDIDITAPAGVALDVDFAADDVEIGSGHGFQGTMRDKRAEGTVNGGGPRLEVRASHGEIAFRAL